MLLQGLLDVSLVPSCSYFAYRNQLQIVPVMSVHSVGPSLSSIVVSRTGKNIEDGDLVAVSGYTETSVEMLRVILSTWNTRAKLERFPGIHGWGLLDKAPFALLIGDEALRARMTDLDITLDIGEAWLKITNSPAVFAVSAVTKSSLMENKEKVRKASDLLRKALESRWKTIHKVISETSQKYSLPQDLLSDYFQRIRLDFSRGVRRGLDELRKRTQHLDNLKVHGFQ